MNEQESKALEAIKSVIGIADSNFPSDCVIRIEAVGKHTASIVLPSYVLKAVLKTR
jgi:hypothetical protein